MKKVIAAAAGLMLVGTMVGSASADVSFGGDARARAYYQQDYDFGSSSVDEETGAVTVFRSPSNYNNGNTRDRQGRLVSCQHGGRSIVRTEYDGSVTTVIDSWQGKRLNSPNDVVRTERAVMTGR